MFFCFTGVLLDKEFGIPLSAFRVRLTAGHVYNLDTFCREPYTVVLAECDEAGFHTAFDSPSLFEMLHIKESVLGCTEMAPTKNHIVRAPRTSFHAESEAKSAQGKLVIAFRIQLAVAAAVSQQPLSTPPPG